MKKERMEMEREDAGESRVDAPPARRLRLASDSRGRIRRWAERTYPGEACGILIGRPGPDGVEVTEVREARNIERTRAADRYELDPRALLAADRDARAAGLEVVGFWHSHPDSPAVPSEIDLARAWPGYVYAIVSVASTDGAAIRAWTLNEDRFQEGELTE